MKNYCAWCCQSDDYEPPCLDDKLPHPPQILLCSHCKRPILLVDVERACSIAQKSHKTMYGWAKLGKVKSIRLPDGRLLIYYSSIFPPPRDPDDEIP